MAGSVGVDDLVCVDIKHLWHVAGMAFSRSGEEDGCAM